MGKFQLRMASPDSDPLKEHGVAVFDYLEDALAALDVAEDNWCYHYVRNRTMVDGRKVETRWSKKTR